MAMTRADLSTLFHGALNTPEEFYQDSVRLHKKWYWGGMFSLVALITLYVMMSYMGMPGVIAMANVSLILVLGFYVSSPGAFLALFGGGAAAKLGSYNWSWGNLFRDEEFVFPDIQLSEMAKQGWKTYVAALKLPAHFLLIAIAAGTVLTLLRIEHPMYAMVFFSVMVAIGMWTFVHTTGAVWYRRITITILVIGALVSFYQAFAGPSLNDLTYSKTLEIEVGTLQPHKLCGVRPGNRKFSVPNKQYVLMDGDNYEVTSYIRVNGTLPNESFAVDKAGCVQVSFAFNSGTLGRAITPQVLKVVFR